MVVPGSYALVETTVRQHLARNYATTTAKISRSEVGRGATSRRGVEMDYSYSVNGISYSGHRFRYDDHNMAFEWTTAVDDFPSGSSRTVFYDPRNPADSVLEPGVDGCDMMLLLFALPMNVLTCTLWGAMISKWRQRSGIPPAGGVRILKHGSGKTRVPLSEVSAGAAGFYGMAAAAFLAVFPVVVIGGFDPPIRLVKATWSIVIIIGAGVFIWRFVKNRSGAYDLQIDSSSQTVTLPQTADRPRSLAVARNEIGAVSLQRRMAKSPSGMHFSYLPVLKRNGGSSQSRAMKLVNWGWSRERAEAFSQWLSKELGVEFKGVEDEQAEGTATN